MSPSERIEATRLALEICLAVRAGDLTHAQGKALLSNLNGFEGALQ